MSSEETEPFVFGPNQTKWLEMLETTELPQCVNRPFDGTGYCCLGIAELVIGIKRDRPNSEGALPAREMVEAMALWDNDGGARGETVLPACVSMNDDKAMTFKMIAAHLRANPRAYFKESR